MIEISRYIPFGRYINNGSKIIYLDPRTKLICSVLMIVCIAYISSFVAFACFLIFCLFLQQVSQVSLFYILRSLRPFIIFMLIAVIFEVLFYVPTKGTPQIWQWWILNVSWKGIFVGALNIVRVIFLYYITAMMTFTTSIIDLTDGMEVLFKPLQKIGIPVNAFIMIFVIAFRFVPIFISELERLIKAQAARGMNFRQGNLFQRVSKLALLLIPLFVSAFKRVKMLSMAMEVRCFGMHAGWQRGKRRALRFARNDVLALALTTTISVIIIIVNIFSPL